MFFLPVFPDGPAWIEFLDLSGLESFILAVIPFANVFGEDILRLLGEVIYQEIESLFCSLTRGHECDAKILGVEDAWERVYNSTTIPRCQSDNAQP